MQRIILSYYETFAQRSQYLNQLIELSSSLEQELEPIVLEFDNSTVTLHGSLQEKSKQWQQILSNMYENGMKNEE